MTDGGKLTQNENVVPTWKDRKCRDIPFLAIFLAFFVGVGAVFFIGVRDGNVARLVGGTQLDGRICGVLPSEGGAGKDLDVLHFFSGDLYTDKELTVALDLKDVEKHALCVKDCPGPDATVVKGRLFTDKFDPKRDTQGDDEEIPSASSRRRQLEANSTVLDVYAKAEHTKTVYMHYCKPVTNTSTDSEIESLAKKLFNEFSEMNSVSLNIVSAFQVWPMYLISFCVALVLSLVYIQLSRCCTGLITYISIVMVLFGSGASGYLLWTHAEEKESDTFRAVAVCLWVFAGLVLVATICLRKQINLAIHILEESTKAISDMPSIMFIPVIEFFILAIVFVFFAVGSVNLMSCGTISDSGLTLSSTGASLDGQIVGEIQVRDFDWNDQMRGMYAYFFFGFLWSFSFTMSMMQLVLALAVARWYFTHTDNSGSRKVVAPLRTSLGMAYWFHSGSVAFGSFLLTLVWVVQIIIEFVSKQVEKASAENKIVKCFFSVLKCCVACFEKCLRWINRQVFIAIAIFGTSFCASAGRGMGLLSRNAARVGALNMIGKVVEVLGSLFVAAASTFICHVVLTRSEYFSSKIANSESEALVVVLMAATSYCVGSIFMELFGHSADTLLVCFIADEEMCDGNPIYAPDTLRSKINEHGRSETQQKSGGAAQYNSAL